MKKSVLNFLSKAAINNRNIACILFLAFLLGGSNSLLFAQNVETDFKRGVDAKNEGDYAMARNYFLSWANKEKDASAQYEYAKLCEEGRGGDTNYEEALKYYRMAKKKGKKEAMFRLARMYEYGLGLSSPDTNMAIKLYSEVDNKQEARIQLGGMFQNRKDYNTAVKHYREAYYSAMNNRDTSTAAIALYRLGNVNIIRDDLADKEKTEKTSDAIRYLKKAWEYGCVDAALALGKMYRGIYGNGKDDRLALKHFADASLKENAEGAYWVGYMFEHGEGVQQDWRNAVKAYQKAQRCGYKIDLQPRIDSLSSLIEKEKDGRAQRRCALIIANAGYEGTGFPPLKKPIYDAISLKTRLEELGWNVHNISNATKAIVVEKIEEFGNFSETCDVSLFFYAGHAVQRDGKSYIIPPQATTKMSVWDQGINVEDIINHMNKGDTKKTKIVIFDACRTPDNSTYASVYGILPVPQGFFLAYSTQPGIISLEGEKSERNSPYMTALLEMLKKPGLKITDLFAEVKEYVKNGTGGEQCPVTYNGLYNDNFIFNLGSSK